jgi:hypothetical protein
MKIQKKMDGSQGETTAVCLLVDLNCLIQQSVEGKEKGNKDGSESKPRGREKESTTKID